MAGLSPIACAESCTLPHLRTMHRRALSVIFTGVRGGRACCLALAVAGALAVSAFARAPAHRSCVVPPLRGDTLATARRALLAAHCRLGAVHGAARHRGTVRVTWQSVRAGRRVANGARVSLWVAVRQQKRARSMGQTIYVANSQQSMGSRGQRFGRALCD